MPHSDSAISSASLSRLPNELILLIATHLPQQNLNLLVRSSKRMYLLLVNELYKKDVTSEKNEALWWAAKKDLRETAELSIKCGGDPRTRSQQDGTMLQIAARHGSASVAELLLLGGADLSTYEGADSPLVIAAEYGKADVVKLFLNKSQAALPSPQSPDYRLAILNAISGGHRQALEQLISRSGIDVNMQDENGWTLLMEATKKFRVSCVRLLIEQPDININLSDEEGRTVLHVAAQEGNADVVEILLRLAAIDVNCQDLRGQSPLYEAAVCSQIKVVEILLRRPDVLVNLPSNFLHTPLSIATSLALAPVVLALCRRPDTDPNWQSKGGDSPLLMATIGSNEELFDCLVSHPEVDVKLPNSRGLTPLLAAVTNGSVSKLRRLLKHPCIEVNAVVAGKSALHSACFQYNDEVAELLLSMPEIDVNLKIENHGTVLNRAIINGRARLVKLLLARDDTDVTLDSPLATAVICGKKKIVQMLLAHPGVQVSALQNGRSPLELAIYCPCDDIMQLLLNHPGINVNARTLEGETILGVAIMQASFQRIDLLLDHPKIDITARNVHNARPLEIANMLGRFRVSEALLQHRSAVNFPLNMGKGMGSDVSKEESKTGSVEA